MSSSNLVRLTFIEESTLGQTPAVGDFNTARFTSEGLSGTPSTTESQQIRSDRLASGQIVTSLEVGGDLSFELAKEPALDTLISSAMMNEWDVAPVVSEDLTIDATAKTITRAAGDFNVDLDVGDIFTTFGFSSSSNNTQFQVLEIVSATVVRVSMAVGVSDEVGVGTSFKRADRIAIGTSKKSFSMEKAFLDLNEKAILYKGMLVNTMNLSVAYGEIVNGSFGFNGTEYEAVAGASNFMTDGRTILPPSTTNSMNGSIDMPFISSSSAGTFEGIKFCVQSLGLEISNNLQAQNCIGKAAAADFSLGTANVGIDMSAYLAEENWNLNAKKLSQEPFSVGFLLKNLNGWYGFYLPAVQVSFDDPSSGGANQEISLDLKGVGKVGPNGESSVYIYRS